jgi:hypothetical protein
VLDLAKHLDLSVVAEGVETEDQLHYLESRGCHYIQGYLTGKPMPAHVPWPRCATTCTPNCCRTNCGRATMNQTSPERAPKADATLALLWERIRRRATCPASPSAINAILASMRGEDEREFSMTQTVLSDPVLTQKVLRLANSGMYSAFGQRINTVSKACWCWAPRPSATWRWA